jgi:putative inorganic carbon (hco3(-)) transporter
MSATSLRAHSLRSSVRVSRRTAVMLMAAACAVGSVAAVGGSRSAVIPVALLAAIGGFALLITWPEVGLVLAIFLLWSDIPVAAHQYHGTSSVIELIVPVLLIAPLVRDLLRGDRMILNRGFVWLAVFFGVYVAATITMASVDQPTGIQRIEKFVQEGLIMYLLVINTVRTPESLRRVMWGVIAGGGLLAFLSVVQQLTHRYDHTFFGLAQLDHAYFLQQDSSPRAQGPLADPNYYAQILLPVFALSVVFAWRERTRFLRITAGVCAALTVAAVAFTYSRGAALALLCLLIALVIFGYVKPKHLLVLALGVVVLLVAIPGYSSRLSSLSVSGITAQQGSSAAADPSLQGRATENLAALLVFRDYPVLGVGPGGFPLYYQTYAQKIGVGVHQAKRTASQDQTAGEAPTRAAHEILLGEAADLGIVGLTVFLGLLIFHFTFVLKARRRWARTRSDLEALATALLLAILGYFIAGLFLSLAFERYFWLLLALGSAGAGVLLRLEGPELPRPTRLRRRG